ncbi:MAG: pyruvate:ferredoxin (flavodoxin) oxidoreductase, partial [Thermoanaerobaculia bacterium]|nr:pyruvate:ferredoxin (flavodoxin) oxidoreductase [Thermoanaerobaculia bacterium]
AFGAKDAQTVKAFQEAESYDGPSIILAYSHCIAHGYDMANGLEQQKLAVDSAYWPIFRFDPRRVAEGQPGLVLDSSAPKVDVGKFMANETRFRMLDKTNPERAKMLLGLAREQVASRWATYENLARGADPVAAVAAPRTPVKAI